jgi:hypothetical protein
MPRSNPIASTFTEHVTKTPQPPEAPPEICLPDQVLRLIFELLGPTERKPASLASKKWQEIGLDIEKLSIIRGSLQRSSSKDRIFSLPDSKLIEMAEEIFARAKNSEKQALVDLKRLLDCGKEFPTPTQNHVLFVLIDTWKKQKDDAILINLLEFVYKDRSCSKANALYIAGLAREGKPLEAYKSQIFSWNPPLEKPIPAVKQLSLQESFERKEVDKSLFQFLIVSQNNTFQHNEIVAVSHKGNLAGDRQKLFYGVIRGEKEEQGQRSCRVFTHCCKGNGIWLDDVWLLSGMIGKIPSWQLTQSQGVLASLPTPTV